MIIILQPFPQPFSHSNIQEPELDFDDGPLARKKGGRRPRNTGEERDTSDVVFGEAVKLAKMSGTKETWMKRWIEVTPTHFAFYREESVRNQGNTLHATRGWCWWCREKEGFNRVRLFLCSKTLVSKSFGLVLTENIQASKAIKSLDMKKKFSCV